jgi:hypothetical protein
MQFEAYFHQSGVKRKCQTIYNEKKLCKNWNKTSHGVQFLKFDVYV